MEYVSNEKRPEIRVSGRNEEYGRLLLNDYTGAKSELTAVLQYSYQHFFTDKYKDLQDAIFNINLVEMEHLEILGELIHKLGVDPKYRTLNNCNDEYYVSTNVPYEKEVCRILTNNINAERNAIRAYNERIREIQDPYVQEVLRSIIRDEEIHLKIFNYFFKKYCGYCQGPNQEPDNDYNCMPDPCFRKDKEKNDYEDKCNKPNPFNCNNFWN